MEASDYIRMIMALIFVLALMGGLYIIMRKFNTGHMRSFGGSASKRLSITQSLPLDARRRLMLIRRDDTEHLIILGPNGETVVETAIDAKDFDVHHNDAHNNDNGQSQAS